MNGLYQVSNLGRVKSLPRFHKTRETILKPGIQKRGYLYVNLCKNNKCKTHRVHRLVAETFISNPNNLSEVNHIDENKTNNCIDNLEWCDRNYNLNYGTRSLQFSKSRGTSVRCVETNITYYSAREASRKTGIYQSSISRCCNNEYGFKTAGGYHWEYV